MSPHNTAGAQEVIVPSSGIEAVDAVPSASHGGAGAKISVWAEVVLIALVVVGLAVLPNVISLRGQDSFRLPKELAFRLHGLIAAVLLTAAIAFGSFRRVREMWRERAVFLLMLFAVGWSLVSTLTSLNQAQSVQSIITVVCGALLFMTTWYIAPRVSPLVLLIVGSVAIINTVVVFLQNRATWSPLVVDIRGNDRLGMSGFIGNPNDVAAYLAIVAIVLVPAGAQMHGWRRWFAWIAAMVALAGIGITLTITAGVAVAAAGLVIVARRSWKATLVTVVLAGAVFGIAVAKDVPLVARVLSIGSYARAGQWDRVLSNRLPAFLAAVEMFKDRPFLGVGPGVYKAKEMPYTVEAKYRYGSSAAESIGVNFGETHNDHLQLLAEVGLPGYALFLSTLYLIAARGSRRRTTHASAVASAIAVPLVAVTVVLCLASFPLQIAATRHLLLIVAGFIVGWNES